MIQNTSCTNTFLSLSGMLNTVFCKHSCYTCIICFSLWPLVIFPNLNWRHEWHFVYNIQPNSKFKSLLIEVDLSNKVRCITLYLLLLESLSSANLILTVISSVIARHMISAYKFSQCTSAIRMRLMLVWIASYLVLVISIKWKRFT